MSPHPMCERSSYYRSHPPTADASAMGTHDDAVQQAVTRRRVSMPPTSQSRRSKRLWTAPPCQQMAAAASPCAADSLAGFSQTLKQSNEVLMASSKRKPSEAFHMTLRRKTARQCTEQTAQQSLQHAQLTGSASDRRSETSPHSSSGQPFDPG